MGQASKFLRNTETGFSHWCPACEEMHFVATKEAPCWTFNGNLEKPTFNPSVKVTGKQSIHIKGEWTGEYRRGPDGKALDLCCHYFLHDGVLKFQNDCTHDLRGKSVPLPELPDFMRDPQ